MVLTDFDITVEFEVPRTVRIIVYDSVKGLRIAATRYENRTKSKSKRTRGDFAETLGLCHRFEAFDKAGNLRPECAIVRLAEPNLGVGIISHELCHAAVWMRELTVGEKPLTADDDEQFAWVLGELVRQAIVTMTKCGMFP